MRSTDQLKVPYFQPIDNGLLFLFSILSIFKLTQLIDRDIVATNFRQIAVDYWRQCIKVQTRQDEKSRYS